MRKFQLPGSLAETRRRTKLQKPSPKIHVCVNAAILESGGMADLGALFRASKKELEKRAREEQEKLVEDARLAILKAQNAPATENCDDEDQPQKRAGLLDKNRVGLTGRASEALRTSRNRVAGSHKKDDSRQSFDGQTPTQGHG